MTSPTPAGAQNSTGSDEETYRAHVVARLFDFFTDQASWPRRLWDAGAVLMLRELSEASAWVEAQVLGQSSVKWLGSDIARILGRDQGIGDKELRTQLGLVLKSDLILGGRTHRQLAQLTEMIEEGYLRRWTAAALAEKKPAPERLARAVAAHLLDMNYSPGFLRAWIRDLAKSGTSLEGILTAAQILAAGKTHSYEVLVPFTAIPGGDLSAHTSNWRSAHDVSFWLRVKGVNEPPRHNGGFVYSVRARDPYAAAIEVSEIVDRLMARHTFANKTRKLTPSAFSGFPVWTTTCPYAGPAAEHTFCPWKQRANCTTSLNAQPWTTHWNSPQHSTKALLDPQFPVDGQPSKPFSCPRKTPKKTAAAATSPPSAWPPSSPVPGRAQK
jgi:hypothetical protein